LGSCEIMRNRRAVRRVRDSGVTVTATPSPLVEQAARLALFTLHAAHKQRAEVKSARGARARKLRSRQLIKKFQEHIDRLPTPTYPGGRELREARELAKATLQAWTQEYLAPLEHYEPGLIVAPVLRPQSTGGAPPKPWLDVAGKAALASSASDVAQHLIREWQACLALPADHPHHCSLDDFCALLLIPKGRRSSVRDASVPDLAREYLTVRIQQAATRLRKKSGSH
jgi:hypothetical protein